MFELLQESPTSTAVLSASALNPESLHKVAIDLCYRGYEWIKTCSLVTTHGQYSGPARTGDTLPFASSAEVQSLTEILPKAHIRQENIEAIRFLDEWFAQPDDLGEEAWAAFDREIEANKFTI
jgi:hypothetical protein